VFNSEISGLWKNLFQKGTNEALDVRGRTDSVSLPAAEYQSIVGAYAVVVDGESSVRHGKTAAYQLIALSEGFGRDLIGGDRHHCRYELGGWSSGRGIAGQNSVLRPHNAARGTDPNACLRCLNALNGAVLVETNAAPDG